METKDLQEVFVSRCKSYEEDRGKKDNRHLHKIITETLDRLLYEKKTELWELASCIVGHNAATGLCNFSLSQFTIQEQQTQRHEDMAGAGFAHKIETGPLHECAPIDKLIKPGACFAHDIGILQEPEQYVDALQYQKVRWFSTQERASRGDVQILGKQQKVEQCHYKPVSRPANKGSPAAS